MCRRIVCGLGALATLTNGRSVLLTAAFDLEFASGPIVASLLLSLFGMGAVRIRFSRGILIAPLVLDGSVYGELVRVCTQ